MNAFETALAIKHISDAEIATARETAIAIIARIARSKRKAEALLEHEDTGRDLAAEVIYQMQTAQLNAADATMEAISRWCKRSVGRNTASRFKIDLGENFMKAMIKIATA